MKITVNNEEVVCSNELTITEEMLTTSSTILNNCYPKSWEQDHDYISRFYYPKDYSKCKISDPKFIPGVIGTTTEGTDITINYDEDKNWQLKQLKGNTYQQTYSGKNLFNINTPPTWIGGGTTYSINDNVLKVQGNWYVGFLINVQENTDYYLSALKNIIVSQTGTGNMAIYDKNKQFIKQLNNGGTFNSGDNNEIYLVFYSGVGNSGTVEFSNIQLEKGNQPTTYEPYVGGTPSPNPDYPQAIQNVTGRQVVEINEQQYEINLGKNLFDGNYVNYAIGGNSGVRFFSNASSRTAIIKCQPNTTYTITKKETTNRFVICDYPTYPVNNDELNNKVTFSSSSLSGTYTTSLNANYLLIFVSNANLEPEMQVEKGSTATTYSPYFTPIELNKIGEYQDYIDGDIDNWYINKNIGKVILNGSEEWFDSGYNSSAHHYTYRGANKMSGQTNLLSNKFITSTDATLVYSCVGNLNNTNITLKMPLNISTTTQMKTWLTTNITTVYYVLAEPTRTKITNTELVGQLNALAQANLLNGYNNIIVNSVNLPASLKIYYNFIDERYEENLMFCGVVKNTGNMSLNPRDPHYASLQVLDFKTMLSEGDTLGFVINNKTVPQAIQMVVDAISTYGVVVGNIDILNSDEVIGAYSTVDKTAYDVLQYLAEISQSRWTTRLIDENTIAIDFYDPTLMPQADDIEYTKEYFENNGIVDIQYNYGTYDYRNKQIMTSDQVYGSIDYVETILADGYNRTFNTTTNIGYIKSIFVNGVSKTFATKDDKEIGIESDFYYTPGQMQIESNENEPIISSNTPIVITYTPLVKGRQIIYNNDEVERVSAQTNRNGIISRYENRNDTLSIDELNQIGQTYIKYKGSAEINLIVNTFNYDLFNVGQLVYFNAPLNELKKQYMVKQKEITMYTAKNQQNIFVKYTLTSSFNSEREVNYFDNQRNKAKGNISAGEYITRNVDIENTANIIFNNLTIEEVEEGNVLNSILNSPLNN